MVTEQNFFKQRSQYLANPGYQANVKDTIITNLLNKAL